MDLRHTGSHRTARGSCIFPADRTGRVFVPRVGPRDPSQPQDPRPPRSSPRSCATCHGTDASTPVVVWGGSVVEGTGCGAILTTDGKGWNPSIQRRGRRDRTHHRWESKDVKEGRNASRDSNLLIGEVFVEAWPRPTGKETFDAIWEGSIPFHGIRPWAAYPKCMRAIDRLPRERDTPVVPPSFSSTSCPTPFHPRNAVEMDTPSLSHRHQPTSIHEDRKGIGSVPNGNPPFQPTLAPGSKWERNRRREGEGMDRPDSSTAHAPETTDVRVRRGSP